MNNASLPSAEHETNLIAGNVRAMKRSNQRSDSMYFLPVADIVVLDGYNVRVETESYQAHLKSIVASLLSDGFHVDSPLAVYPANIDGVDKPVLIRGHTRLKAVLLANAAGANIDKVPVVFKAKSTSPTDLDLDLINSNSGRNLTPFETSVVIKRLMTQGMEPKEIVQKTGISLPHIDTLVTLASAPPRLASLVAHDEVSTSLAVDLIRKYGPVAAQRMAIDALERAKNAGHKQATVRNLPEAQFNRAVKKAAPRFYNVTAAISNDPGFAGLSEETRKQINDLLQEVASSKGEEAAAATEERTDA